MRPGGRHGYPPPADLHRPTTVVRGLPRTLRSGPECPALHRPDPACSVPSLRARRVPGADYHEGQGGSQRRGTRWSMRCGAQGGFRNVEFVTPQAARRLARSVAHTATGPNGTRRRHGTRVSRSLETRRVVIAPAKHRIRPSRRFSRTVGSPRVARRCASAPPVRTTAYCADAVMVGPAGPEVNGFRRPGRNLVAKSSPGATICGGGLLVSSARQTGRPHSEGHPDVAGGSSRSGEHRGPPNQGRQEPRRAMTRQPTTERPMASRETAR